MKHPTKFHKVISKTVCYHDEMEFQFLGPGPPRTAYFAPSCKKFPFYGQNISQISISDHYSQVPNKSDAQKNCNCLGLKKVFVSCSLVLKIWVES